MFKYVALSLTTIVSLALAVACGDDTTPKAPINNAACLGGVCADVGSPDTTNNPDGSTPDFGTPDVPISNDTTCTDDPICAGRSDADALCDGNIVTECLRQIDGCLDAFSLEDCAVAGLVCDASSGTAVCRSGGCVDDTECNARADGDSFCTGATRTACALKADGCLDATVEDCFASGQACNDNSGTALCVARTCTDDAACIGAPPDESRCDGNDIVLCSLAADGCLDAALQQMCGAAMACDPAGPVCVLAGASGNSCAMPFVLAATSMQSATGSDFNVDYADGHQLTDASCSFGSDVPAAGAPEAVFEIALDVGDQILAQTANPVSDEFFAVTSSCSDSAVCLDTTGRDWGGIFYRAETAGTYYVFVSSMFAPANWTTPYELLFEYFDCGDGTTEFLETCDDGNNVAGDGCSPTCRWEAGYGCDNLNAPSSCSVPPDLGSHGAGQALTPPAGRALSPGESDFFTVTFTEEVKLVGSLAQVGSGDIDFYVWAEDGTYITGHADDADETIGSVLPAGAYVVEVNAWDGAGSVTDYTLTLSTQASDAIDRGSFAGGDLIADMAAGPLTERIYDHYRITFSEDVLLSGSLSTAGIGTINIYDATGTKVLTDDWSDAKLDAGTYIMQIQSYSSALGGGTLTSYTPSLFSEAN